MSFENVEEFFRTLHKEDEILFRCIKGKKIKNFKGKFDVEIQNSLSDLNEVGYEIYFVSNTGGYKDENITRYNTVFVDMDCGKDEAGNYKSMEIVQLYKQSKISELNQFIYHLVTSSRLEMDYMRTG